MSVGGDGAWLHDRATRGETLTAAEQARLEAWYAAQDAAEATSLARPAASETLTALRAQIGAAAAQLETTARRVHELTSQNAALREETAALHRRLALRAASPVA